MSPELLTAIVALVTALAALLTQVRTLIELIRNTRTTQSTHALILSRNGVKTDDGNG